MVKRDLFKAGFFLLFLAMAVLLILRINTAQDTAETELVRTSVKEAALTCYAVEGAYPDDLEYLRENYHLAYNEERYFVTYQSFAWNQFPDIYVTERGTVKP